MGLVQKNWRSLAIVFFVVAANVSCNLAGKTTATAVGTETKSTPASTSTGASSSASATTAAVLPVSQIFLNGPSTIQSGLNSGICFQYTLSSLDAKGNPADVTGVPQVVTLSMVDGVSSVVKNFIYGDAGCTVHIGSTSIPVGHRQVVLYVKATNATSESLAFTASATVAGSAVSSVMALTSVVPVTTITLGGAAAVLAGSCSTAITITLDAVTTQALSVNLSSTGSGKFYSDSACSGNGNITLNTIVPPRAATTQVYFKDTVKEAATVSAVSGTITSNGGVPRTITVNPSANQRLVWSGADTDMMVVSTTCKAYTISAKDIYNNAVTTAVPTVNLLALYGAAPSGNFYSDIACTGGNEITTITLVAGTTPTFYYQTADTGLIQLSASFAGYSNGNRSVNTYGAVDTVKSYDWNGVTSWVNTSHYNVGDCNTFYIGAYSGATQVVVLATGAVALSDGAVGGKFYNKLSDCSSSLNDVSSVAFPVNKNAATAYYKNYTSGAVNLTATFTDTAFGWTVDMSPNPTPITMDPLAGTKLSLVADSGTTTATAGSCAAYHLSKLDKYGNAALGTQNVTFPATATSGNPSTLGIKIYPNNTCIPASDVDHISLNNTTSVQFGFKDTASQSLLFTATCASCTSVADYSTTINVQPGVPASLQISGSSSIDLGTCMPYKVSAYDANGNGAWYGSNTTLTVNGAAPALGAGATGGGFSTASTCSGPSASTSLVFNASTDIAKTFYFQSNDIITNGSVMTFYAQDPALLTSNNLLVRAGRIVTSFVAGTNDNCVIANGGLACWGGNTQGMLGLGDLVNRFWPESITTPSALTSGVTSLALGSQQTCAMKGSYRWCWGNQSSGALGDGITTNTNVLFPASNSSSEYGQVFAGTAHGCVLENGALSCWGQNTDGELGVGDYASHLAPVAALADLSSGIKSVALGDNFSCAIENGGAHCWGSDANKQLGDAGVITAGAGHIDTTVAVSAMASGVSAIAAHALAKHACAIQDSSLYCWGLGDNDQNGDVADNGTPVAVGDNTGGNPQVTGASAIAVGQEHSCVLRSGQVLCWGSNSNYQIGSAAALAAKTQYATPVDATWNTNVVDLAVGAKHTCALKNGKWFCVGMAGAGQLGNSSITTDQQTPVPVTGLVRSLQGIVSGGATTCALLDGGLQCWGGNFNGQLGNNSTVNSTTPVQVLNVAPDIFSGAQMAAVGGMHACAVSNGGAYCWGDNSSGQLGINSTTSKSLANLVSTIGADADLTNGVQAISAGFAHSCAIATGAVYCWGNNAYGQLGIGSLTDKHVPMASATLTMNIQAIAAGGYHTCAIQNGAVYCWGYNLYGQLGNGSPGTNINDSAQVLGVNGFGTLSKVTQIATGLYHTCAVVDGALYCWGAGAYGQLGNGITSDFSVPVKVKKTDGSAVTGVVALAAGNYHTCAIVTGSAGQEVLCWGTDGYNNFGAYAVSPTATSTVGASHLALGSQHSCFVKNGHVFCWGQNLSGQLGSGGISAGVTDISTLAPWY